MIALALVAALTLQDTNSAISPRVRAMLSQFPPPRSGQPSIAVRFSRDSVWVGEQVELVTAAWFPRRLRDRLRHSPNIKAPSLSGLWSARNQMLPLLAESRVVGNQAYDLFVTYQTIFALGSGGIDAPPAVLTYDVPTSTSYFAPEERHTLTSAPAHLAARGIPRALISPLGGGPTAHDLHLVWRGPVDGLRVGSPAIVELAIAGAGNLTLWPAPSIAWPGGIHRYPEPTDEHVVPVQGVIAGEKRFRFTVVPDSAGVLTLPAVSYPFFDPATGTVRPAVAGALSLPIRPRLSTSEDRQAPLVTADAAVPIASRLVRSSWPLLWLLALLAPLLAIWRRRGVRRRLPIPVPPSSDPEATLRAALGTPVAAGPDRVVASLRARGVPRDDAEHILRWLSAAGRRRYGPSQAPAPEVPPAVTRALARLLRGATLTGLLLAAATLHGQSESGISRYQGHDYVGAARAFQSVVDSEPSAAGGWLDLGAARWMNGEDVAAAASWIRGLELAPRDPLIRSAWGAAVTIPADVRDLAPSVPASRDELLLLTLAFWCVLCGTFASGSRRLLWAAAVPFAACATLALVRTRAESTAPALVTDNTPLRISPHPAMTPIGELPQWAQVQIERRDRGWVMVSLSGPGGSGVPGSGTIEGWVPATSVVEIRSSAPMAGSRATADR